MRTKVLYIITRLDRGGTTDYIIETIASLDRERYQTMLVYGHTNDPDGQIKKRLHEKNIRCFCIDELQRELNLWKDTIAFLRLYSIIKKEKFDIVHTHSSKAGIVGRWAAWIAGTKYIVHTPHGHIFYGYFGTVVTKVFIYIERLTGLITDKIITLTQIGKEDHIRFKIARAEKFIPIYSGIEVSRFRNTHVDPLLIRKKMHIPPDTPVIGTVSRLTYIKGNAFLIDALSLVIQTYPQTLLLVIGDGEERNSLEDKVQQLGLVDNVRFLGFRDDVFELLHALDIFVLASLNEGLGKAILEAMACGKPVIASRTGGVPEVVRDGVTGILVPPGDSESLARTLLSLMGNKEKAQELGMKGKEMVSDVFSVKRMIENIDDVYKRLIEKK
ncbi:MAG: glycosyltransferase family 4 protein [Candidatus Omnitrophica bacterium]|nr:glycosyltransferase family 4 protein [Candidatus Omnitrophota bacterium]